MKTIMMEGHKICSHLNVGSVMIFDGAVMKH